MGTRIRNVVLLVVIALAFSGLAMADYYLRHETTGKTRRGLQERGIDLSVDAALAASANRDLALLEALESVGIDLGEAGASGETALIAAVRSGDGTGVDFLLSRQTVRRTLDHRSEGDARTALQLALKSGEFSIAEKLMAAGATLHGLREEGVPLLIGAVNKDDVDLFDFLMRQGLEVDEVDGTGRTALAIAVAETKAKWVPRLLAAGAEVNQLGLSGEVLLLESLRNEKDSVLKSLIDHGAVVNLKSEGGESPLMIAVKNKNRETISLLLDAGANADALDAKAQSIADRLIEDGDVAMLEFFANRTEGEITDEWMIKVFESGKLELLEELLKKGANVEAEVGKGGRLLKQAVLNKDTAAVNLLLRYGADARGELWDALAGGSQVILEKLLVSGADANESLVLGVGSPLSLALRQHHYDSAEILLKHGANPSPRQEDGRSLLEAVESRGDERAAALLRDYCADYQEELYTDE